MTPLDLKTKEEWQDILDRFATETQMSAILTDNTGKHLIGTDGRYPLCAAVRQNKKALTFICSQTNTTMLAVIGKTLRPEVDLCEVGLIRLVVPIVKDGSLIGQVTACGLASHGEEPDSFLVSKELGISEEKAIELAQSTPLGSEEELQKMCARLFDELAPK